MSVRLARLEEAHLLARMHHEIFEGSVWEASFWEASVLDAGCTALVAEENGIVVGLSVARQILDEAELLTIGVLPAARRRGHAQALLDRTLDALGRNEAERVFLEVAETNHGAIALYRGRGFVPVGHRKDYYGSGKSALVMEWRSRLPGGGGRA